MSLQVWWPLFPFLFSVVLTCQIMVIFRLGKYRKPGRLEWTLVLSALVTYALTYALGRWPWLHMPMSNLSELIMLVNLVYFFRKGRKDLGWLYVTALAAVGIDFLLHYILK